MSLRRFTLTRPLEKNNCWEVLIINRISIRDVPVRIPVSGDIPLSVSIRYLPNPMIPLFLDW